MTPVTQGRDPNLSLNCNITFYDEVSALPTCRELLHGSTPPMYVMFPTCATLLSRK